MECSPYPLTAFDHQLPPTFYTVVAISFPLRQPGDAVPAVQAAVTRLIHALPFLAGAVGPTKASSKTNVMGVRPASGDHPILDIKHYPRHWVTIPSKNPRCMQGMEPAPELKPEFDHQAIPCPVLRIRLSVLANGAILCFAIHHMTFDGTGAGVLLNLFAHACRGEAIPTGPEDQEATRKEIRAVADHWRGHAQHAGQLPAVQGPEGVEFGDETERTNYNLIFSGRRIAELKSLCNSRLQGLLQQQRGGKENGQPAFVSSNDVLTALLWICINHARSSHQDPPLQSLVSVPVNVRKMLSLPDTYLANAMVVTTSLLTLTELTELTELHADPPGPEIPAQTIELLTRVAHRIRCQIAQVNREAVGQYLAQVSDTPDWARLALQPADVVVSSLRGWDTFALDFGETLGSIVNLEYLPFVTVEGECLVKPRRTGVEESWEVMVTLGHGHLSSLRESGLLRWALNGDLPVELCQQCPH